MGLEQPLFPIPAYTVENLSQKPLWEAGIFLLRVHSPSYPGAVTEKIRHYPLPTVTYRGRILRSDENESPRARLFKTNMSDLDVSASGYFSSDSEGTAREGMPDLDWVGELGPRWNWWWVRNPVTELRFALPFRGVFTTTIWTWKSLGVSLTPGFVWDQKRTRIPGLRFSHRISFRFVDRRVAGYFYNVAPIYVTPERPVYSAENGYLGESVSSRVTWQKGRVFTSFGVIVDDYTRSSFRESPLLQSNFNVSGFFGIGYDLIESKERAIE